MQRKGEMISTLVASQQKTKATVLSKTQCVTNANITAGYCFTNILLVSPKYHGSQSV